MSNYVHHEQDWPTSYTTRDSKGKLVGHGTAFEFVEVLQEKFGFTYEVVVPEDNDIGDRDRGLLGMLNHKVRLNPRGMSS